MFAGELRDWVTVQRRAVTTDDFGGESSTWNDVFSDYAKVEKLSGREFFSDARIAADVDTRITIRYRAGIKTTDRVYIPDDGRILDIEAAIEDRRRTQIELMCKEAG